MKTTLLKLFVIETFTKIVIKLNLPFRCIERSLAIIFNCDMVFVSLTVIFKYLMPSMYFTVPSFNKTKLIIYIYIYNKCTIEIMEIIMKTISNWNEVTHSITVSGTIQFLFLNK